MFLKNINIYIFYLEVGVKYLLFRFIFFKSLLKICLFVCYFYIIDLVFLCKLFLMNSLMLK